MFKPEMAKREFVDFLEKQGYTVGQRKIGGGHVNDVRLITARKGDRVFEYVLKKYGSEGEVQDMLRGYDAITSVVKTPTIVYQNGNEVAYDLVNGRSVKEMIEKKDPKAPEAIRLLAIELEKLHKSRKLSPRYKRGNSPDEKRMIKHITKAFGTGQLGRAEAEGLVRQIREYVPGNKTLIHGDAHLGNFMYSESENALYIIDPDNVSISDYNADIGKVVHAIERLGSEGKLTGHQQSELSELFLATYNGEDSNAVKLFRARTPLIELKNRPGVDWASKAIGKVVSLERKVASAVVLGIVLIVFLTFQRKITGLAVGELQGSGGYFALVWIIIIGLAVYFLSRRKKVEKNNLVRKGKK